jgi:hypothetical protein
MKRTLTSFAALAVCVAQIACYDSIAPIPARRDLELLIPGVGDRLRPLSDYTDDQILATPGTPSPEQVPPEFQQAPSIISRSTAVKFEGAQLGGAANMRYYASHASQTLTFSLRNSTAGFPTPTFESAASDLLPWVRDLRTEGRVVTLGDCGHLVNAGSSHRAWHQFPLVGSLLSWGQQSATSDASAQQPPCSDDPGAGGGGGGTIIYTCYCQDYYSSATQSWVHGGIIYCLEA